MGEEVQYLGQGVCHLELVEQESLNLEKVSYVHKVLFLKRFCPKATGSHSIYVIFFYISHRLWCWWIWSFTNWRYATIMITTYIKLKQGI